MSTPNARKAATGSAAEPSVGPDLEQLGTRGGQVQSTGLQQGGGLAGAVPQHTQEHMLIGHTWTTELSPGGAEGGCRSG